MKKRYSVNFARHLADCEFNYRRMCLLMPGWGHYPATDSAKNERSEWRYLTGWQNQMVLQVTEAAKYTTTVHISVDSQLQKQLGWFKTRKGVNAAAVRKASLNNSLNNKQDAVYTLDVRLYHDANLAEVITFANQRRFLPRNEYPNHKMHQQDEKSQLNLFLGEILDNCLQQGRVEHAFEFSTS